MIADIWFQRNAVSSVFSYFDHESGNPLVAMPTGTGKSVVIALLIKRIFDWFPNQRIIALTHDKHLIEQNAAKLEMVWPEAPMGIYSAGLRSRDTVLPIIFGGIASVDGKVPEFGWRDLILIDEAHLLGPNDSAMYQRVIAEFKKINPKVKVIGFTATPYRMGQGMLIDDGLFTHVCYDITGTEAINRLIHEGFMAPLVSKKTDIDIDTSKLSIARGDFQNKELELAVSRVVIKACEESAAKIYERHSGICFAPGVDNVNKIAGLLTEMGVSAVPIHSKLPKGELDRNIKRLKEFEVKVGVTNNMLTTGFDHPALDFILMMRPTLSVPLWVQMLGRGTRVSPATGKTDCLVLDFAHNTRNLGTFNAPYIPKKRRPGGGDAPVRICGTCGTYCHASARRCFVCDMEFDFSPQIVGTASHKDVLTTEHAQVEDMPVAMVVYASHTKRGQPNAAPCLRVSYITGVQRWDEYIHLEAPYESAVGKRARDWWRLRHADDPPATVREALAYQHALRQPKRIRVIVNRKYPEIVGYEFE